MSSSEVELRDPWAQLPEEGKADYTSFVAYTKLPPKLRSLKMLAHHLGLSESTLKAYSTKFQWKERVAAYDLACQHLTPQELSPGDTLAHQHAVGKAMLELGIAAIELKNPGDIKTRDAVALIKAGAEMQRKAIGADEAGIQINISGGAVDALNSILDEIELDAIEVEESEE